MTQNKVALPTVTCSLFRRKQQMYNFKLHSGKYKRTLTNGVVLALVPYCTDIVVH